MVPAISMAWENKESDIMRRPPREAGQDRLVTRKLVVFSYLQIGVIQAVAGFYTWFVVMYVVFEREAREFKSNHFLVLS